MGILTFDTARFSDTCRPHMTLLREVAVVCMGLLQPVTVHPTLLNWNHLEEICGAGLT